MSSVIEHIEGEDGKRKYKLNFWLISFYIDEANAIKGLKFIAFAICAISLISIAQYYLFFSHCSISLSSGRLHLECPSEPMIVVSPSVGFQNSGIKLTKGDTFSLEVTGAVHVSGYQPYNRARGMRCVIYHHLSQPQRNKYLEGFRSLSESPDNPEACYEYYAKSAPEGTTNHQEWYRHWVDESGENRRSDMYFGTKLNPSHWGSLLWVILPSPASEFIDPYEILGGHQLDSSAVDAVRSGDKYVASRDGYLHFIVNDAVISGNSPNERAKAYFGAVERASRSHVNAPQQIQAEFIPLYLYGDNRGFFVIRVERN